ncbi:enoyl-CoA hydratase/isomerase family protein [Amycolatopsis sp. GM8]|uniref:enoyl-CoA hydratase/isomerase family protein n=1 Tax=Amycolatopsis sp. GM8 TaxID=2896530 RepID=UPI001F1CED1C|nr:enoyl-CoA hydratase/isomerase family protein [Amycolatopsis sp. GM8]
MVDRSGSVRWERAEGGLVVVTFDSEGARSNLVTSAHVQGVHAVLRYLRDNIDDVSGVLLTSSKNSFFAGPDYLPTDAPNDSGPAWDLAAEFRQQLRDLETIGRPVAAALVGSALGGGFEISLAAHYRVGLDDPAVRWQLAERTMGILPGGGGTVRSARLVGMATAIRETVGEGAAYTPRWALHRGLVDELASTREDVEAQAKKWLRRVGPAGGGQPWEREGYQVPGGVPGDKDFDAELAHVRAELDAITGDITIAARQEILGVVLDALSEPVDTAFEKETAAFARLAPSATTAPLIFGAFKRMRDRVERGQNSLDLHTARSWRTFTLRTRHPLLPTFAPDAPERIVEVPIEDGASEETIASRTAAAYEFGVPVLVRAQSLPVLHSALEGQIDASDYVDQLEATLAHVLFGVPLTLGQQ